MIAQRPSRAEALGRIAKIALKEKALMPLGATVEGRAMRQPDRPSLSEAVRRLIDRGLRAGT